MAAPLLVLASARRTSTTPIRTDTGIKIKSERIRIDGGTQVVTSQMRDTLRGMLEELLREERRTGRRC
jgi:hypothetical protein